MQGLDRFVAHLTVWQAPNVCDPYVATVGAGGPISTPITRSTFPPSSDLALVTFMPSTSREMLPDEQ